MVQVQRSLLQPAFCYRFCENSGGTEKLYNTRQVMMFPIDTLFFEHLYVFNLIVFLYFLVMRKELKEITDGLRSEGRRV